MDEVTRFTKPRLLITLALPDPAPIELPLLKAFEHVHVILLGIYPVKEQTSPEQAEAQFGESADAALAQAAESLRRYEVDLDTHLVFTARQSETVRRIVDEEAVDAVLYARPLDDVRQILVPLRSEQQPAHIAAFVGALVKDTARRIQLRLLIGSDAAADSRSLLEEQTAALASAEIDPDRIEAQVVETDQPAQTIVELSAACDLLVLGELESSPRARLFGQVHERIIPAVDCPVVLVLQR